MEKIMYTQRRATSTKFITESGKQYLFELQGHSVALVIANNVTADDVREFRRLNGREIANEKLNLLYSRK